MFDPEILRGIPNSDWIALSNDESRVVAHGPSLPDVIASAKSNGEDDPLITGVPVAVELLTIFHDA